MLCSAICALRLTDSCSASAAPSDTRNRLIRSVMRLRSARSDISMPDQRDVAIGKRKMRSLKNNSPSCVLATQVPSTAKGSGIFAAPFMTLPTLATNYGGRSFHSKAPGLVQCDAVEMALSRRDCGLLQRTRHNLVGVARQSLALEDRLSAHLRRLPATLAFERLVAPEAAGKPCRHLRIAFVKANYDVRHQPVARRRPAALKATGLSAANVPISDRSRFGDCQLNADARAASRTRARRVGGRHLRMQCEPFVHQQMIVAMRVEEPLERLLALGLIEQDQAGSARRSHRSCSAPREKCRMASSAPLSRIAGRVERQRRVPQRPLAGADRDRANRCLSA